MSINLELVTLKCGKISRTARIIAIDEKSGKLAVIRKQRNTGTHDYIEFYNILTGWIAVPELTICPQNGSIEHAMFVSGGELMTSHANGSICFIDPHDHRRVKRIQVAASTIWAACDHPMAGADEKSRVALISHSSILYFFDVINKVIISSVSLGVDTRLFDVSSNGELLAIGAIDEIIIAGSGKVQRTLKLDRENRRDPTIAWSVLFWSEEVLACGDSRGSVTIWNPSSGALIQTISCMQSHILTMCMNGDVLNVAGVDPRITSIQKMPSGEYQMTRRRNGPVRDVRSLAVYDEKIYASGEDFDIFVGRDGCHQLLFQWNRNVTIADEIIAIAGENYVDIWWKKNGEDVVENSEENCEVLVPQHHENVFLAKVYSPKKNLITCWALSDCGKYLAIGTSHETSTYLIEPDKKKLNKLAVLQILSTSLWISSKELIVANGNFEIYQFDMNNTEIEPKLIIKQSDCGNVSKMSVSPCRKQIAVLTSRSQVFLINTSNNESRLAKVDLPIDVVATSTHFAHVLSSHSALTENCDSKKVIFEVSMSNGTVKRSTTSNQLKMVATSPKSVCPGLPIGLLGIDEKQILVWSYDGHWSIVDTEKSLVLNSSEVTLKAKKRKNMTSTPMIGINVIGVRNVPKSPEKTEETDAKTIGIETRRRRSSENAVEIPKISSRIVVLKLEGDEQPKTNGFKLKKFGMQ